MRVSTYRSLNGLSRFIDLLKREPDRTLKYYSERLGCNSRQCQKWLADIEVTFSLGQDPSTGRGGVKLWRIRLPKEKREAARRPC